MSSEFLICPYCGTDLKKPIICPKCHYENEANSKFCQECGTPLRGGGAKGIDAFPPVKVAKPEIDLEPPPAIGISIEFPFSSAQSFDFAVKEAMKFSSFKQYGQDKKAIYRVTVQKNELGTVAELLEQLKGWRKRTVYLDGEKVQWDSIFSYSWCYVKKASSYKPEFYCYGYENEYELNIWGCIQAHMPFNEQGRWFCWGKWQNSKGDWEFDKERIRHELEKALYNFRFCPALSTDKVEAILSAIPNSVNPTKDHNWKFVESWGDESVQGLTVTVDRYGFKEKVTMRGVAPSGQGAIREIAQKMKLSLPLK